MKPNYRLDLLQLALERQHDLQFVDFMPEMALIKAHLNMLADLNAIHDEVTGEVLPFEWVREFDVSYGKGWKKVITATPRYKKLILRWLQYVSV